MAKPGHFGSTCAAMIDRINTPTEELTSEFLRSPPIYHQRILVVDQKCDILQLNAEALIDAGYQVNVADDGASAWAALRRQCYDLLITGQFLPKVSGVELLRKIHAAHMTVPVIMSTRILPTWEFALHPWLQHVTMLRMPYTVEKFLALAKSTLPAAVNAAKHILVTPTWRTRPAVVDFAKKP